MALTDWRRSLPEIAAGNLDVAVIGQLAAADFSFDD
jgi:hypothetical protein